MFGLGMLGAAACGASVVCGVAVGIAAGFGSYAVANAGTNRWNWGAAAVYAAVGGAAGGIGAAGARASASAASGASSAAQGARLNARLAADEIASGHSYTKHVVQRGEFPGIRTRAQFADVVENVINHYDEVRHFSGGRTAFWRDGVVVIRNPAAPDGGTAFAPVEGYSYFLGLS